MTKIIHTNRFMSGNKTGIYEKVKYKSFIIFRIIKTDHP